MAKRAATAGKPKAAHARVRDSKGAQGASHGWTGVAVAALALLLAFVAAIWTGACSRGSSSGAGSGPSRQVRAAANSSTSAPSVAEVTDASAGDSGARVEGDKPYDGPLVGAAGITVPIYADMDMSHEKMVGYLRSGAKAPVNPKLLAASNCKPGWYKLIPRGYVCGKNATLDLEDPRVRLGTTEPKLDQIVPYTYAYNTKDGTPLYRSVPSREQMSTYEPYLTAPRKPSDGSHRRHKAGSDAPSAQGEHEEPESDSAPDPESAETPSDGGVRASATDPSATRDAGEPDAEVKPWWDMAPDAGRPDIKLSDLTSGADSILAKRMVKGFFVAVDKTFGWNHRLWYKTTQGLVAPAERMAVNKPPTFHGVEIGGSGQPKLPVGFVTATGAFKYELGGDKEPERKGKAPLHTIAALTGKSAQRKGVQYRETTDGWWMRAADSTLTEPGPPPADLGPNDKWIDINLTRQTLVAFEGARPVYATAISTGKKGETKDKDHSTVQGTFRVREKHIAATMDGDAAAPGEGPYSIEDVPFIMYFKGSYALHGAFWHNNWGHKMSHGCVNLSPLDAKHVFLWSSPTLPQGWHGVWATKEDPGTVLVVHE
jgi:hypothetical protein